jgi:hypothetical protein
MTRVIHPRGISLGLEVGRSMRQIAQSRGLSCPNPWTFQIRPSGQSTYRISRVKCYAEINEQKDTKLCTLLQCRRTSPPLIGAGCAVCAHPLPIYTIPKIPYILQNLGVLCGFPDFCQRLRKVGASHPGYARGRNWGRARPRRPAVAGPLAWAHWGHPWHGGPVRGCCWGARSCGITSAL